MLSAYQAIRSAKHIKKIESNEKIAETLSEMSREDVRVILWILSTNQEETITQFELQEQIDYNKKVRSYRL